MMTPTEADRFAGAAAAYVHIPFCSEVCPYCDFAVVAGRDHLAERYVAALCAEISGDESWRQLDAVYFGGGTPSRLEPALLAQVLAALEATHGIASDAEISIEANPEDFSLDRARACRDFGFNRVSFGSQSFDDEVLLSLGRRHHAHQIEGSMRAARDAGFENVSLDLIYGTPGETRNSWMNSLEQAIALDPTHLSCYALTVEPGTPLGRSVRSGSPAPDPDVQADRYLAASRQLSRSGYHRYEVSNWSKPGFECRYNLTVWAQGEYVAYGNGAHGYRNGRRYRNHRRLDAYLEKVESGTSPRAGADLVEGWDAELDRLFVGLRRTVGVSNGSGTETLLATDQGRQLMETGVITRSGGRLVVERPLLTDAVHRSVLSLTAPIVNGDGDA